MNDPDSPTLRRIFDLRQEMNDRFRQIDHQAQLKKEFWSGFTLGVIVGFVAGVLFLLSVHVK